MIYVGVENSNAKRRIAGRRPVDVIEVDAADLAWDCQRHIGFLREADRRREDGWDEAWMVCSAYAGWFLETGRTLKATLVHCRAFLAHFAYIRAHGVTGPWATVTEDGLRLDGSHRAAIAVVLGRQQVPVAVVPYRLTDWAWRRQWSAYRARRIQEEAACQ